MKKEKIYLSGPMSGYDEHNFPSFNKEALRLRSLGYDVVNPADINKPEEGKTWHECLKNDLKEMLTCDTIALLPGWLDSQGAHLEVNVGHRVGMAIVESKDII